jgi:hypothetical protein
MTLFASSADFAGGMTRSLSPTTTRMASAGSGISVTTKQGLTAEVKCFGVM